MAKLNVDDIIWVPKGVKPVGYDEYLARFPHLFDDDPDETEEKKWRHVARILVRRRQEINIAYMEKQKWAY